MSAFEVKVRRIDKVEDHPDADRLSIVSILGFRAITNKLEDGSHRYKAGDLVVYVPENAVVPEMLLKQYGYWNNEKDKGMLAGKAGDRVKIMRLRGIYSQGLVWPTTTVPDAYGHPQAVVHNWHADEAAGPLDTALLGVRDGDDVAEFFGITKYEPPIPAAMNGDAAGIADFAVTFDFDSVQRWPEFFQPGEPVVVTEKLHGTFTRISYRRNVTDDRLFGDGHVAIASKGLGAKGIVFIDTPENRAGNVYVRTAVENDLIDIVGRIAALYDADEIDLMGETFGKGIQRLAYGMDKPQFRMFALRFNRTFVEPKLAMEIAAQFELETVPVLYRGPFDPEAIERIRDGSTTVFGPKGERHIREGVVIVADGKQTPREHKGETMRPILKWVSPAYLMKEDGSEVQ